MIVKKIISGLTDNFTQEVLTTSRLIEKRIPHIHIAKSWFEIKSLPFAPSIVFKLWKRLPKTDIVCVHYPYPIIDIVLALYPFKLPKLVVYWHSDIISQKYLKHLISPFTRKMLYRANKIIVSSPNIALHSSILTNYQHKIEVIPFGINPPTTNSETTTINQAYYLAIGRHVPYKGYKHLIEAMKTTNHPLKIIGKGPMLEMHKNMVAKLGLDNQIEFIEQVNDEKLNQYIKDCYALVFPSTLPSEAFGLVQIEAMSYGKPIINTNLKSGVPWVARDKKEAITITPGSSKELSEAINQLGRDSSLYNKLAIGALDRYNALFTSEHFLRNTKASFDSLIFEETKIDNGI